MRGLREPLETIRPLDRKGLATISADFYLFFEIASDVKKKCLRAFVLSICLFIYLKVYSFVHESLLRCSDEKFISDCFVEA